MVIASPTVADSRSGNSVTAARYSRMLRELGYRVTSISAPARAPDADFLIALHARKTAPVVASFRRRFPDRPIVVVLTGTDVYRDLGRSRAALQALQTADAIVTLQPLAIERIPRDLRSKAFAVVQSASARPERAAHRGACVAFCVLGHLRREKDPLRAAYALRYVPRSMQVKVVQAGAILDDAFVARIARIESRDRRYRYCGDLSHNGAMRLLARSDALVLSSRMEGGANVASEAIALGVPVLASRIDGNVGIFGRTYPGYYEVASSRGLAALIERFAGDRAFAQSLRRQIRKLRPMVTERRERESLDRVLKAAVRRRRTAVSA